MPLRFDTLGSIWASSVQFSHSVLSDSLRSQGLQHARLPCPSPTPGACSNSSLLSWWSHSTISSTAVPFSCLPSVFPSIRVFSSESALHVRLAKILEFQLQYQSLQWIFWTIFLEDWLVWPPCSPRDSQEYSPASQFKSINSWVLSFLYSLTLTSIHDYWKNHTFD